ncbi:MAG: hypothetical protein J0M08_04120 [Bacteroidetes bacterium]|nr:hypothetical protein [Bacteroidota bacterium]
MQNRERIHTLIHSLTKGEKRYFKMWVNKEKGKNYIVLFDAIEKQKEYDEDELKLKLRETGISDNFAVIKNRLYNVIIDSMTYHNIDNNKYGLVAYYITQIEYILNKGDADYAYFLYQKAEAIVKNKELIEMYPALLNVLMRINLTLIKSGQEFVNENRRIRDMAIQQSKIISRKFDITFLLNSLILHHTQINKNNMVANEQVLADVVAFKNQTNLNELSLTERIKYNNILYFFHAIKKEKQKQLYYLTDTLNFLIKNKEFLSEHIYVESFYRSLINLYNEKDYKTFIAYMHKYKMVHSSMFYSEKLQASSALMISYLKIGHVSLFKKEFFALELALKKIQLSGRLELELKYWLSYGYFIMGEYKKSNKYAADLFNNYKDSLRDRFDLHIMLRFMQVLKRFDQNKLPLFVSELDELKKLTVDYDSYFSFCNLLFSPLYKILKNNLSETQKYSEFLKLKKEVASFFQQNQDVYDSSSFLDISAWIKSKLQKTVMIDLM